MSETYRLTFKDDQNNIVFDGETQEMTDVYEVGSGGTTDLRQYPDYSVDPTGETEINAYVNRYILMPSLASRDFIRLSTEDVYTDAILTDESNGVRIVFNLSHSGTRHIVNITSFQKYCGKNENNQDVWTELWTSDTTSIGGYWDTGQEGCIAFYHGTVTGKISGSDDKESVGIQFVTLSSGQFNPMGEAMFWEVNVFEPIYDYSGSYLPTDGNITIGGRGDGSYPSDPAERPDIAALNTYLGYGSTNGIGLTYYSVLHVSDIYEVFAKIYSNSYINVETRLKAMIDAFRIPFTSNPNGAGSNLTQIPVADVDVTVSDGMAPIVKRFAEINFGVFDLSNYGWDDFNDFKNTRATLYLPFHGRVNIDINAIARGTIEITTVCDTYTGNIVYWVYTTSMQAPREVLYGVYEGQSAVQIPIASTYTPNMMGKIMTSAGFTVAGVAGAAAGNPIAAGVGAAGFLMSLPADFEQSVDRSHMQDSAGSATSPLHIRLDIERREMLRTEKYREYAGIPAFVTQKLKELEGFVRVHSADYDGLKCEQSEKEAIKAMLEEGIYI